MLMFSDIDQILFPEAAGKPERGEKARGVGECIVPRPNGMIHVGRAWQKAILHSWYKRLIMFSVLQHMAVSLQYQLLSGLLLS